MYVFVQWLVVVPQAHTPCAIPRCCHPQGTVKAEFLFWLPSIAQHSWTQVCLLAPLDDILTQHILNKTPFLSSHTCFFLCVPVTFKRIAGQSDAQGRIQEITLDTLPSFSPCIPSFKFLYFSSLHVSQICRLLSISADTTLTHPLSGLTWMTLVPSWHPTRFILHSASRLSLLTIKLLW